jgi:hypothetical protein
LAENLDGKCWKLAVVVDAIIIKFGALLGEFWGLGFVSSCVYFKVNGWDFSLDEI